MSAEVSHYAIFGQYGQRKVAEFIPNPPSHPNQRHYRLTQAVFTISSSF